MKRIVGTLVICLLLASSAWGGYSVEYKTTQSGGRRGMRPPSGDEKKPPAPETGKVLLEKFKLKVQKSDSKSWFVGDLDKQSFFYASPDGVTMGPPGGGDSSDARKEPAAVTGTLDDALNVIDQFMEQMGAFAKSFQGKGASPGEGKAIPEPKRSVKALSGTKNIAGCATHGYQVLENDKPVNEVWACPDIDLSYLMPKFVAIGKTMAEHAKKWKDAMPAGSMRGMPTGQVDIGNQTDILAQIKGFPFMTSQIDENGKLTTNFEVTKFSTQGVADSEFQVPAGYKTIPVQDFLNQMMAGMGQMMGGMGGPSGHGGRHGGGGK